MMLVEKSPIISTLADDPDMVDLVREFTAALPARVRALQQAAEAADLPEMVRLAHQMKGASGGYGFGVIGDAAAVLENLARTAQSVNDLQTKLDELVSLCWRAQSPVA